MDDLTAPQNRLFIVSSLFFLLLSLLIYAGITFYVDNRREPVAFEDKETFVKRIADGRFKIQYVHAQNMEESPEVTE